MSEKCEYNVVVWCLFVAVSVASVVGAQCDGPVDTFLRAQGGHPATPTVSGCGYIILCVVNASPCMALLLLWWLRWRVCVC